MPENEKKTGFWYWISENPMTFIMVLLLVVSTIAIFCGYKEGFATITGGLIGVLKGSDAENKQRLEEAKRRTDEHFSVVRDTMDSMKAQQAEHDTETEEAVGSAKAEVDSYDVDELIDLGGRMLEMHRESEHEKGV